MFLDKLYLIFEGTVTITKLGKILEQK